MLMMASESFCLHECELKLWLPVLMHIYAKAKVTIGVKCHVNQGQPNLKKSFYFFESYLIV